MRNIALKQAIFNCGQTQRRVGAAAGIRENRFSSIVNGWATPRPQERKNIAQVLGRSEAELFRETSLRNEVA